MLDLDIQTLQKGHIKFMSPQRCVHGGLAAV